MPWLDTFICDRCLDYLFLSPPLPTMMYPPHPGMNRGAPLGRDRRFSIIRGRGVRNNSIALITLDGSPPKCGGVGTPPGVLMVVLVPVFIMNIGAVVLIPPVYNPLEVLVSIGCTCPPHLQIQVGV